jgi:hypothetical protein
MRKSLGVLIALTLVLALGANSYAGVSTAAVLFLRIAAGARAAGMGEAFVAVADDATATHWNPAGLGQYPLTSTWFEVKIPAEYHPLRKIALFKAESSEIGYKKYDIWALSRKGLVRYSRGEWSQEEVISAKPDQSSESILRQYTGLFGEAAEEKIPELMVKIGQANNEYPIERIDSLESEVMAVIPEDYSSRDNLENAFFALKESYNKCLVDWEMVDNAFTHYGKALKDSIIDDLEADKILLAVEKSSRRFLPGEIIMPIGISIEGGLNDITSDDKFLWVAGESGLYRYDGDKWQRFGIDEGLPDVEIKGIKLSGKRAFLASDSGLILYEIGAFTHFGPEQGLPRRSVSDVATAGENKVWAVVDNDIYLFDGNIWRNYVEYEGARGITGESVYDNMKIYDTPREKEKYLLKYKALNPAAELLQVPKTGVELTPESVGGIIDSSGFMTALQQVQQRPEPISGETAQLSPPPEKAAGPPDSTAAEKAPEQPRDTTAAVSDTAVTETESVPAVKVKIPYTAGIDFRVLDMEVDDFGNLWMGTEYGLLRYSGRKWRWYGYRTQVVDVEMTPEIVRGIIDSSGFMAALQQVRERENIAIFDFALKKVQGDTTRAERLASNLKAVNHLESDTMKAGQTIKVYANPAGARINDIHSYGSRIIFGTVSGTIIFDGRWSRYNLRDLGKRNTLTVAERGGDLWYVTRDKIEISATARKELTGMHVNWLKELANDMYYEFFGYTQNVEGWGTLGGNVTFLTFGDLPYVDEFANELAIFSAYDLALTLSYGTPLTSTLSGGISAKVIYSNLSKEYGAGKEKGEGTATSFAVDLGLLYRVDPRLTLGMALTNLGPDVAYIDVEQADPLPRNLAIGIAWKMVESEFNEVLLTVEANKSLAERDETIIEEGKDVFANPQGELKGLIFNPFTMGGLTKEFKGVIINGGMEYQYGQFFSLRAGYIHDEEGAIKTLTLGAGLAYSLFRFDFAYIPSSENLPLANTMRFSLSVGW